MWNRTVLILGLLAMSSALAATAAHAAPLNFYVGGSIGDSADLEAGFDDLGIDSDDPSFKILGGVGLGRILAVEAAWHELGNVTCCSQVADAGFDVDVRGVSVNVLAGFVISKLRLFVKGGLMSWEVDGRLESLAGPVPFSLDGEDPMGGVGATLNINRKIAVRAEWELFDIADDNLNIVSAGITYRLW